MAKSKPLYRVLICMLLISSLSAVSHGQELLRNGSFEGLTPIYGAIPEGWAACGGEGNSPDVQPISSDRGAEDGEAYIGLISRVRTPNNQALEGSVESVYQQLPDSLIQGAEYVLTFYLMYDSTHKPSTPLPIGTSTLHIYLGKNACDDYRVIWESPIIDHHSWELYTVRFIADCGDSFLKLESGFGDTLRHDLNYIMIDDISLRSVKPNLSSDRIDCDQVVTEYPDSTAYIPKSCVLYLPNAFSPNGDDTNPLLLAYPDCNIIRYAMKVFDRWGNMVFESSNEYIGWDGTVHGKEAEEGIYYYVVQVDYFDTKGDKRHLRRGSNLNLIR